MNFFEYLLDIVKRFFTKLRLIVIIVAVGYFLISQYGNNPYLILPFLIIPPVVVFLFNLYSIWATRHDKNNLFFHPTPFIRAGFVISVIGAAIMIFLLQCRDLYGMPVNRECVSRLLSSETPSWQRKK